MHVTGPPELGKADGPFAGFRRLVADVASGLAGSFGSLGAANPTTVLATWDGELYLRHT